MQCQRPVACASFENLERGLGFQAGGEGVDMNVEQGDYEVCVGRVDLGWMSTEMATRQPRLA